MHTKSLKTTTNTQTQPWKLVELGGHNCIVKYLEVERTADSQNVRHSSVEIFHFYLKGHLFFGSYGFD